MKFNKPTTSESEVWEIAFLDGEKIEIIGFDGAIWENSDYFTISDKDGNEIFYVVMRSCKYVKRLK